MHRYELVESIFSTSTMLIDHSRFLTATGDYVELLINWPLDRASSKRTANRLFRKVGLL